MALVVGMRLELCPITWKEAQAFIALHHRHHIPPQGWKFGIGLARGEEIIGVITVGRPIARHFDDGWTLEATRCCVQEGIKNGCSMLYGAAYRAAKALGYKRLITYTLASESGTSLRAAGWREVGRAGGGSWNVPSRPRVQVAPTEQKTLWEAVL